MDRCAASAHDQGNHFQEMKVFKITKRFACSNRAMPRSEQNPCSSNSPGLRGQRDRRSRPHRTIRWPGRKSSFSDRPFGRYAKISTVRGNTSSPNLLALIRTLSPKRFSTEPDTTVPSTSIARHKKRSHEDGGAVL